MRGLPRWLSGKESTCQAGVVGSILRLGRSLGERNGNPLQYSWRIPWTEEPGGYSPWSRKESDMTEQLSVHTALKKRKDTSSDTKRKVESV